MAKIININLSVKRITKGQTNRANPVSIRILIVIKYQK